MATYSEELREAIINAAIDCEIRKMAEQAPTDGTYCNITFDGIACWGYTRANTTAEQLCPEYIMLSKQDIDMSEYAYKTCESDGQWYKTLDEEGKLVEWTNYTQCVNEPEEQESHGKPLQDLQIIYTIGYSISLVALLAAMVIFLYFRKLRCPRNTIHMHLFMSFILRAIFVFIRDTVQEDIERQRIKQIEIETGSIEGEISHISKGTPGCKAAFSLIQYFLVANFYWLLVEGVYLHSLITLSVFSERSNLIGYILLGWGCPVLVVLPWTIVQSQQNKDGCWWENVTSDRFYWIIKGPVMFSIVINFFLFLNILRVLFTKLRASNAAEAHQYSKLAKSTLVLIPLFGVYYIISVGMYASNEPLVVKIRMYFELTLSPIQGFLVALLYCFMNGEVRTEIKRKWRVRQLNRNLSAHRSVRNGNSSSFSGGNAVTCNEIREPLRPGKRIPGSNGPVNRTHSTVKERLLALKKNAFGSNSTNGHVQLGNGSVGRRLPRLSQTDLTDSEPSPRNTRKASTEAMAPRVCMEAAEGATYSEIDTPKPHARVAPLARAVDEFSRIHDSEVELNDDDGNATCKLYCEDQTKETQPLAVSGPSKLIDNSGSFSDVNHDGIVDTKSNEGNECPPAYTELFPEVKPSTSMSNIETQV